MASTAQCYSKAHVEATEMFNGENDSDLVSMNNYAQIPKELFDTINKVCGPTTRKANKVCKACIRFSRLKLANEAAVDDNKKRKASQSPEQTAVTKKPDTIKLTFDELLHALSEFEFTHDQLVKVMDVLGQKLSPSLLTFVNEKQRKFERNEMITQDTKSFLQGTFQPLRSFFTGIRTGFPTRYRS